MKAPNTCTVLCSVHKSWSSVHRDAVSVTQIRILETIYRIYGWKSERQLNSSDKMENCINTNLEPFNDNISELNYEGKEGAVAVCSLNPST